jgi:hypothetical protein
MLWNFEAEYSTDNGATFTAISNLQNVTITGGRQAQIDNFAASRLSLTFRYPNGFASPAADLLPGAHIYVTAQTTSGGFSFDAYYGYITDVSVEYGIPYANNIGNADYLIITAEGGLAKLARNSGNGYAMAAGFVAVAGVPANGQIGKAAVQSGVDVSTPFVSYYATREASAATVSGSWADWLNQLAFTFGGRISDGREVALLTFQPIADYSTNSTYYLSDTGTGIPYDQITVDSLAQNYFTQVTVDPDGYAAQTVSTGAAPYRNYTVNTWSPSTAVATDLANYYLNNYDDPTLAVSALHINMNDSTTGYVNDFFISASSVATFGAFPVGVQLKVLFRGQTYVCIVEGGTLSATPGSVGLTLYVSGADLNAYLILNNATFGKLDSNRLGF